MTLDDPGTQHLRGIDRTLRATALGACLLITIWVLRDILLLVFASVLLACILRGASGYLQGKAGLGSALSLLAVIAALASVLGVLLWWRGTAIAGQTAQMADELARQAQRLWEQLGATSWGAVVAQQLRGAVESVRKGLRADPGSS